MAGKYKNVSMAIDTGEYQQLPTIQDKRQYLLQTVEGFSEAPQTVQDKLFTKLGISPPTMSMIPRGGTGDKEAWTPPMGQGALAKGGRFALTEALPMAALEASRLLPGGALTGIPAGAGAYALASLGGDKLAEVLGIGPAASEKTMAGRVGEGATMAGLGRVIEPMANVLRGGRMLATEPVAGGMRQLNPQAIDKLGAAKRLGFQDASALTLHQATGQRGFEVAEHLFSRLFNTADQMATKSEAQLQQLLKVRSELFEAIKSGTPVDDMHITQVNKAIFSKMNETITSSGGAATNEGLTLAYDRLLQRAGGGVVLEDLYKPTKELLKENRSVAKTFAGEIFDAVEQTVAGRTSSLDNLSQFSRDVVAGKTKINLMNLDPQVVDVMRVLSKAKPSDEIDPLVKDIAGKALSGETTIARGQTITPEQWEAFKNVTGSSLEEGEPINLSMGELRRVRSWIRSKTESHATGGTDDTSYLLGGMNKAITQDVYKMGSDISGFKEAYDAGNKFYSNYIDIFNPKAIREILDNEHGQAAFATLIRKGDDVFLDRLKRGIGAKVDEVSGQYANEEGAKLWSGVINSWVREEGTTKASGMPYFSAPHALGSITDYNGKLTPTASILYGDGFEGQATKTIADLRGMMQISSELSQPAVVTLGPEMATASKSMERGSSKWANEIVKNQNEGFAQDIMALMPDADGKKAVSTIVLDRLLPITPATGNLGRSMGFQDAMISPVVSKWTNNIATTGENNLGTVFGNIPMPDSRPASGWLQDLAKLTPEMQSSDPTRSIISALDAHGTLGKVADTVAMPTPTKAGGLAEQALGLLVKRGMAESYLNKGTTLLEGLEDGSRTGGQKLIDGLLLSRQPSGGGFNPSAPGARLSAEMLPRLAAELMGAPYSVGSLTEGLFGEQPKTDLKPYD